MRKLDLRDYQVTQKVKNPIGKVVEASGEYQVKDSVLNLLFLPDLRLQGAALVRQNVLAIKIEQSGEDVMLEEEEYQRVKAAAEKYAAQSRADVELIDRILNQTPEIS